MDYPIATRELAPQPIVSMRDRRTPQDLPRFLGGAFGELFGRLRLLGASPAGPPFVVYHEFGPDDVDAEVCVPVAQARGERLDEQSTTRRDLCYLSLMRSLTCRPLMRSLDAPSVDAISGCFSS